MRIVTILLLALVFVQCSKDEEKKSSKVKYLKQNPSILQPEPYAMDSAAILIENARIMTATGTIYEKANLLMEKGIIQKISEATIEAPEGVTKINGEGMTLTPGLIDIHSHMGVYPSPAVDAHADGNEASKPVTSQVWAEHGFWPQDPDLWRAQAGGITTIQVLPGSANLIGGRSFIAKLIPKLSAREMRFPGAPQGLKMACGENPKRVYQEKGLQTRMGNVAGYRKAYQEALEYAREWEKYNKNPDGKMPKRNFVSETLVKVMKGEILVHFHCYRADDISAILDVAKEFGFKIRAVHHGLEAYKIAPRLAKEDVGVATWADWWGFKAEAFDGIPYNIALLEKAGGKPIVHSDSAIDVRFLNVEAGKALASAKKLGLNITEDQALRWVTANAAWALGLDKKIGTLEVGKHADIVAWDGHPLSIYSKAQYVFVNGKKVFDRKKKERFLSDFEVGFSGGALHDGRQFSTTPVVQNMGWTETNLSTTLDFKANEFVISKANVFIKGKWQKDTSLHIKNGKIIAINPSSYGTIKTIDGANKWITPGIIESSSRLGLFEIELDSMAQDLRSPAGIPTPDYMAFDALNTHNNRIANKRQEGVLTSLSHARLGSFASSMGVAFDLTEDRVLNKKVALYGRLEKNWALFGVRNRGNSRSSVWSFLRQFLDDAKLYNKNPGAFNKGSMRPTVAESRQLAAMNSVLAGKIPWVLMINRADDIKNLIQLKKDYGLNVAILGGAEAWKVAKGLKRSKIPVIMAPSVQTPMSFNSVHARFDQAAYLHNEGVELIITDGSDFGAARTRQEAGFAVKYGLSKEAALKAITETPGKVFGLNRGTIKKGAEANIVMWNGDPLEPSSWATNIWIGGKAQSLMNRHRALGDKYLKSLVE